MAGLCPSRCGQTGGVAAVHPRPVFALRSAAIRVMRSTEHGSGDHFPGSPIDLARLRRVPVEAHVAAGRVVVPDVRPEVAKEMPFAKGDDVVGCLPADAPDDALAERILPRTLRSADDLLDAQDPGLPGCFINPLLVRPPDAVRTRTEARDGCGQGRHKEAARPCTP